MRPKAILILMTVLFALAGCSTVERRPSVSNTSAASAPSSAASQRADKQTQGGGAAGEGAMQNVSLQQADASQSAPVAVERKIIRNAELSLETDEPQKAMRRVASVAEARGG